MQKFGQIKGAGFELYVSVDLPEPDFDPVAGSLRDLSDFGEMVEEKTPRAIVLAGGQGQSTRFPDFKSFAMWAAESGFSLPRIVSKNLREFCIFYLSIEQSGRQMIGRISVPRLLREYETDSLDEVFDPCLERKFLCFVLGDHLEGGLLALIKVRLNLLSGELQETELTRLKELVEP